MRVTKPEGFFIVLGVFILLFTGFSFFHTPTSPPKTIADSPTGFQFEIADTPELRVQGLSGRKDVPENYGMLFVFGFDVVPPFWMKDMFVPIDILWITKEGAIVGIERVVEPNTYPQTFSPPIPIRYVLETRANEAEKQEWEVGMQIWLPY